MRRLACAVCSCFLVAAASAASSDLDIAYTVKADNLSRVSVIFKLDDAKPCTAQPGGTCSWDIAYGSHRLDAYVGSKRYSRDFELSDESDIQVHCKFDGTSFSGDSC